MGYVLSAVIVPDSVERFSANLHLHIENAKPSTVGYDILPLDDSSTIIATQARPQSSIPDAFLNIIRRLYSRFLVVDWDDRIGLRKARIEKTDGTIPFGEQDELFVELDDDGNPIHSGRIYSFEEVEAQHSDLEFETCKNAIELACEASKICEASVLMIFIRQNR